MPMLWLKEMHFAGIGCSQISYARTLTVPREEMDGPGDAARRCELLGLNEHASP